MKILYLNKIETNAGWGAETFLRDALENAGVETESIDYVRHEFGMAGAVGGCDGGFDALLLQRGCGYVFPVEILQAVRRPKVLLFSELVARNRDQYSLIGARCFDHVFARTMACRDLMISNGWVAEDACSLSLGACPDVYLGAAGAVEENEKDIDVLWIGTIQERRRAFLDRIRSRVDVVEARGFGAEMAGLVRRAKIVLNIHAEDWLDTETRIYEVLGCEGFVVSEKLSEESPFRSGEHLVEAANVEGMIERIEEYLERPEERARIAAAGRREILRNHTFAARAKEISAVLSRISCDPEVAASPLLDESVLERAATQERKLAHRARARSWLGSMVRKVVRR